MPTHPVFLRLSGRRCVVLGGDAAAAPKARACRDAGAAVTLIAEDVVPDLAAAVAAGDITHVQRAYRTGDLAAAFLCYASLADPAVIEAVRAEATREGVLLNVIDRPEACDFFAGAVVARDSLQIAVGTDGRSPAAAAHVRRRIEAAIGPEYGALVAVLGAVRRVVAGRSDRHDVLRTLTDGPLPALLRDRDVAGVDRLLGDVVGDGCSLARLGIAPAGTTPDRER
jgi:siroheme synthase-like protein